MFHLKSPGKKWSERLDYKIFSSQYICRRYDLPFISLRYIWDVVKDHVFVSFVASLYIHMKYMPLKSINLPSTFKILQFSLCFIGPVYMEH